MVTVSVVAEDGIATDGKNLRELSVN